MVNAAEFRQLKDDELAIRVVETRQELFNLRFQHATGQLDNSSRLGQLKKDIARLETIIRQREIVAAESARTPNEVKGSK
jgi:large subunit ribosomal protein L29